MVKKTLFLALSLILLWPPIAEAKIRVQMEYMIPQANRIVVADVASVTLSALPLSEPRPSVVLDDGSLVQYIMDTPYPPSRVVANVVETIKGAPTTQVEFYVPKTWLPNGSEAKGGEHVLLFLCQEDGLTQLCGKGRGVMTISIEEGTRYASFPSDVQVPESIGIINNHDGSMRAPLADVLDYVCKHRSVRFLRSSLEIDFEKQKSMLTYRHLHWHRDSYIDAYERGSDVVMISADIGTSQRWIKRDYYFMDQNFVLLVQRTWFVLFDQAHRLEKPRQESETRFFFHSGVLEKTEGDIPPFQSTAEEIYREATELVKLAKEK